MAPAGEFEAVNVLAIIGALLFSLVEIPLACVRVEVPALPQPSTKNARIAVRFNGEAAGKVRLGVRLAGRQARRWIQTDTDGIAMLTDLPEGTTCLLAIGENNLTSSLCLDVPKLSTSEKSSFYMVLGPAEF